MGGGGGGGGGFSAPYRKPASTLSSLTKLGMCIIYCIVIHTVTKFQWPPLITLGTAGEKLKG